MEKPSGYNLKIQLPLPASGAAPRVLPAHSLGVFNSSAILSQKSLPRPSSTKEAISNVPMGDKEAEGKEK